MGHFGALHYRAANDNWPVRSAQSDWPLLTKASDEDQTVPPDWLLRAMMVLATAGPLIALWSALPWLQDWLAP